MTGWNEDHVRRLDLRQRKVTILSENMYNTYKQAIQEIEAKEMLTQTDLNRLETLKKKLNEYKDYMKKQS
jgi:hypothetical protein